MNAVATTKTDLMGLLHYSPETGEFKWIVTRGRMARAGCVAGTDNNGRRYIKVNGRLRIAARLAFLYMTGREPKGCIDHIDGNPKNNSWANLRECTHAENMQNKRRYKNNKAGLLGVSPAPRRCGKPWRATIKVDGRCHHLGIFNTEKEAHLAYCAAKERLHRFNPTTRSHTE